jgi:PadR family transcriptional regulator PadR
MGRRDDSSRGAVLPGILDMLVLKTLTTGPLHGYGIARRIEQTSGNRLRIEDGSIYPALQRLQLNGWVTSRWETSPTSRKARFYQLTRTGRRQLEQEASAYEQMVAAIAGVMQAT